MNCNLTGIRDIKAFDRDDEIVFKVKYTDKEVIEPADMSFYLEALPDDVQKIETALKDHAKNYSFENRHWHDVDNRATISIEYSTLKAKSYLRDVASKLGLNLFNVVPEEFQWMLYHNHEPANFMDHPGFFDIEVDPIGLKEVLAATTKDLAFANRIYCVGFSNNDWKDKFLIENDEITLLKKAFAVANQFSCITGWYSGEFDIPYLQGRCDRLGLKLPWKELPHIDMMWAYDEYKKFNKEFGEVIYKSLDYVSKLYLGKEKIDLHGYLKLHDLWTEGRWVELETYCMNDVYLLKEIYDILPGVRQVMDVEAMKVKLAHLEPTKRFPTRIFDNKMTEFAIKRNMAIPGEKEWQYRDTLEEIETGPKGAGGLVMAPHLGLHYNIMKVDFASLYPTIYISHNIGINTADWNKEFSDSILTEELNFRPEPLGLNAEYMKYLLEMRMAWRKERDKYVKGTPEYIDLDIKQAALKSMLVSANGAQEQKDFRYKNKRIYNSCTKTGQEYLRYLIEAGESLNMDLIQSDTDGVHFKTEYDSIDDIVANLPDMEKAIADYVKEKAIERWNIPEHLYVAQPRCEQISSHFFSIAKKMYVSRVVYDDGKMLDKPRFDAKGMPAVKYNTLPLLKEILKNIFKEAVFKVESGEDYVGKAADYLLGVRDDLFSHRRDDWLTFAQRVDDLNGHLPHNRAAAKLAAIGKFEPGMIVRFIRRKDGTLILPDYEDCEIDNSTYNYYWSGAVAGWIRNLLPNVAAVKELNLKGVAANEKFDWM